MISWHVSQKRLFLWPENRSLFEVEGREPSGFSMDDKTLHRIACAVPLELTAEGKVPPPGRRLQFGGKRETEVMAKHKGGLRRSDLCLGFPGKQFDLAFCS